MTKSLKIGFCYGLFGGGLNSSKYTALFKSKGFEVTKNLNQADIIIAHSAGCWLLPESANPKIVFYVGLPIVKSSPFRDWLDWQKGNVKAKPTMADAILQLRSLFYAVKEPRYNYKIVRMARAAEPVIYKNAKSIYITNQFDPWPQSDVDELLLNQGSWAYIGMPGKHDDLWQNPKDYVNLIDHYARLY